jgi:small conductance mechanosensitive channel
MITTKPLKQWEVGRELRRRIKKAFDQHNIEIPFPHRTIYWGAGQKNN